MSAETPDPWRLWLDRALSAYSQRRLEFVLSLGLIFLGGWLMFTPRPLSYAFLFTLAPGWVWGLALGGVGFAIRWAIRNDKTQWRAGLMLAVVFIRLTLLAAVGYSTGWVSTTIPEHVTWLCAAWWAYYRASQPAPKVATQ